MQYIKQLDSLRAIAVALVVISHWIPKKFMIHIIPTGQIGVDMFFVLSGFLITAILFNAREKAVLKGVTSSKVIKSFYIRRALRIFPIYYITIIVLYLLGPSSGTAIREAFIYFATYTSNFYFFSIGQWDGMISHLWSLAVEEQYYLIWPWIVLWCRKKYMLPMIILFIAIGISSQWLLGDVDKARILTFTSFDAFGLGSLLAWVITYKINSFKKFYQFLSILSIVVFCYAVISLIVQSWHVLSIRTTTSILTLWIVAFIYKNKESDSYVFKYFWNNRFLIFIGKISYGIYLYHLILPTLITSAFIEPYINDYLIELFSLKYPLLLVLVENTIIVISFSWLSYRLVEQPFLSLKKYFQYVAGTVNNSRTLKPE